MSKLIRFKTVEFDSRIFFKGVKKKCLKFPVRSVALIPDPAPPADQGSHTSVPEIFWQ